MNKALKLMRKYHRMNQKDLALKLKISAAHLCEIEKGKKNVTIEMLHKYSDIFGMPASSLMYIVEQEGKEKQSNPITAKALNFLEWLEVSTK